MKKIISSILILGVFLVGCEKESQQPTTKIEEVEKVEANKLNVKETTTQKEKSENPYFFPSGVDSATFVMENTFNYTTCNTELNITEVEKFKFGSVYELKVDDQEGLDAENTIIGYFLVTKDLIVRLNSKEEIANINEPFTVDDAFEIGDIVCSTEESYGDYVPYGGDGYEWSVGYYDNETIYYYGYNRGTETAPSEKFMWKEGVGLTYYESGYSNERGIIKLSLPDENNAPQVMPVGEKIYKGKLGDINVTMTININNKGKVTGTYYYDKYKKAINIEGNYNNGAVRLTTKDGKEKFVLGVGDYFLKGKWYMDSKEEKVDLFDVESDKVAIESEIHTEFKVDGNYIYFTKDEKLYKRNISNGKEEVLLTNWSEYEGFTIYEGELYFVLEDEDLNKYLNKLGSNKENISLDVKKDVGWFLIYKGRIYFQELHSNAFCSMDLNGKDLKEIELPKFYSVEDEDKTGDPKKYRLDMAYNDYLYFNSDERGPDADAFRISTDGTKVKQLSMLGYLTGCAKDLYFYVSVNSSDVEADYVEDMLEMERRDLYEAPTGYKDPNEIYLSVENNDMYEVVAYALNDDDYHHIVVMDFTGNILNEIKVKKDESNDDYMNIIATDDYIYFKFEYKDEIYRVKYLDNKIETVVK